MAITHSETPPESGVVDDRFVDTFDGDKIYLVNEDFDVSAVKSTRLIDTTYRPSAPLTFEAISVGNSGNYITTVITDGGATGTSALVVSGSGTRAVPYLYTFNMFDDNNSNDDLIALLAGDLYLTATGADATDGDVTPVSVSSLDNGVGNYLTLTTIRIAYAAEPSPMTGLSSEIPSYLPQPVRNTFAEYLAARLSNYEEGGNARKAAKWEKAWNRAMDRSFSNRTATSYPNGMRPA